MTTYFACVSDSKNYQPRAIFIPMKNISKELLDKITEINSLGNIIGEVYKFDNNIGKIIGHNIEGNFEISSKISSIVDFFQGLIHFLEMDDFRDLDDVYSFDEDNKQNNLNSPDKKILYPDNYKGIPIDYSNILFWFVDIHNNNDWKNILENYRNSNGDIINLFDYIIIEKIKLV